MEKLETDILILGAGFSGLVAADFLSQAKKNIIILEKDPEVGGLAKTLDFKGFRFDIGGHRFCFSSNKNKEYFSGILEGLDILQHKQKSKILFNDKYINYPIDFSSILEVNKKYLIKILFEIFCVRRRLKEHNFESWVKNNYGKTLYEVFFKNYTEKVWGKSCNELSSFWADKRIGSNNVFNFFKYVFMGDDIIKERMRFFSYPQNGIGAIVQLIEEKLQNTCRIFKNVQLEGFSSSNCSLSSLTFVSGESRFEVSFKHMFSSIPISTLCEILGKSIHAKFNDMGGKMKYRNLLLVNIIVNKRIITNWHWCYFPYADTIFSRLYEPKFWSEKMVSEKNRTMLCAEIFCDYKDQYWSMVDSELIEKVKDGLRLTKVIQKDDVVYDACVRRIQYAYPLFGYGFEEGLLKTKEALGYFKNTHLIGRSGTHSYYDMEECAEDVLTKIRLLYE